MASRRAPPTTRWPGVAALGLLAAAGVAILAGGCPATPTPAETGDSVSDLALKVSAPSTVEKDETVRLSVQVEPADAADKIVLEWYQTYGRVVSLSATSGAQVEFVAPSLPRDQILRFRVDARLPDGRIVSRDVEVTVLADKGLEPGPSDQSEDPRPRVRFETSKGVFVVELDRLKAPITVRNFLAYVNSGFYEGTIFHRVIPGFVVQGGGLTPDLERKSTRPPIVNESDNGLRNDRGTIAMARTNDPDSATSQFFINLVDNDSLNARPGRPGYAVFGRVISGMDVIDAIARVETESRGGFDDVPVEDILVLDVRVLAPGEPIN